MTIEQLATRVAGLERAVANLQQLPLPLAPRKSADETFGMFADDLEFEEIVRLGRQYRDRENAAGE